jgi:hypothetical protein
MNRIDDIKSRLAAVVPGPWHVDPRNLCDVEVVDRDAPGDPWSVCTVEEGLPGDEKGHAHAALIANAPADLTYLLAEVERLRGEIETEKEATLVYLWDHYGGSFAKEIERGDHRKKS